MMLPIFNNIWNWIQEDYRAHPLRFMIELLAWAISIGCSLVVTITVPHVPFMVLYPLWLSGCSMYAWASWTRNSFGMFCNYILLITIDLIGFYRVLTG
jgi:hypothetical protein